MIAVDIFSVLYKLVPIIGIGGFMPQVWELIRLRGRPPALSMKSWGAWCTAWAISFGYGIFCLKDPMFATTAFLYLSGNLSVIILTLYKGYKYAPRAAFKRNAEAGYVPKNLTSLAKKPSSSIALWKPSDSGCPSTSQ